MMRVLVAPLALPLFAIVSMLNISLLPNVASVLVKPPTHPLFKAPAPWSGAALNCLLSHGLERVPVLPALT